ncbi:MAG: dihydropteridine reductase [Clostridia bacterium]|nr:dihydropteridine reductase [Clostridia bacterium]
MQKNEQRTAEKIRARYMEKEVTDLDRLREIDRKVTGPVKTFSYTFGSIAAIIMGAGMSLCMTDIGTTLGMTEPMLPGIAIGITGMALALLNYPIYKAMLHSRQKKYAPEILDLSDKIINE